MTPVDLHIKASMLEFPSIFPTRLKVLEHDFVVLGNGKDWLEDGTLGDRYRPDVVPESISVDDLDRLIETVKKFSTGKEQTAKIEAQKAERIERGANIDVHATTVDPKAITTGYYGNLSNILHDLATKNYTGRPYLNIWNIPQNVEPSWWAAANEIVEAAIRGSNSLDDREYMRLCWKAMTDFVEGRAEAFIAPAKPETREERYAREDARLAARKRAFAEIKLIERILNRNGHPLNMESKRRADVHMSNGTYSMSVYQPRVLTEDVIAKIDRAMVKNGYARTEDERPTWENGREHRVALRLFPFAFEGLYEARIMVVGSPDDEHDANPKVRRYFAAAQTMFDKPDAAGRYAVVMAGFHPNSGLNM